jgi:glycosyltransferase involved in cell wall biosynthesis
MPQAKRPHVACFLGGHRERTAGVPTRHSGIPEAVSDGETGILVEENDVEGMMQAIAALLADPRRAEAMGKAGRARVLAHFNEGTCEIACSPSWAYRLAGACETV